MKHTYCFSLFLLFALTGLTQKLVEGTWEGKLNLGGSSLRMVLHLKKDSTGYSATMDSPDQGAFGIKTTGALLRGDSLFVEVPSIGGKISGAFVNDTAFLGQWFQGVSFPLSLFKTTKMVALSRPQEPKPPYPYLSEDVIYTNKDKRIQYGATITTPKGVGPFPAILLITGSGQQNRDEELFGHKPFAVIADYLTRLGYIVLRVDDRGIGSTTGDVKKATSQDFAQDVMAGLDYLKSRSGVDKTKLGLLGHSEGGMIAQIVAAERSDVAFVVSLAGPGQKIIELMVDQNRAALQNSGLSKQVVDESMVLYKRLVTPVINAPSDSVAKKLAKKTVAEWKEQKGSDSALIAMAINDDKDVEDIAAIFRTPWFLYFLKYDPAPYIHKMKAKVLALNGDKDIQVDQPLTFPAGKHLYKKAV